MSPGTNYYWKFWFINMFEIKRKYVLLENFMYQTFDQYVSYYNKWGFTGRRLSVSNDQTVSD